ncbi:MAG: DNA damage-inducible protein D [Chloroflexota bacterium]|nr:DNA damage-inducible protein D [Chloroflexota bacterium]
MSGPNFDAIKHLNPYNVEYWEARELQPLLGYKSSWQNFEKVIEKARVSCEATGNIVTDHFNDAIKPITGGKGAVQHVKDYYLSRLACYLIAMNGDPRKPEISLAQQYFAVSTRAYEIHQLRQAQEIGVHIRLQVVEGNKNLSEAAAQAGVRSESFGIFHDSGYLGLYAMDSEDIRLHKGIPEGSEILDHMGSEELAANLFRITQTDGKLRRERIVGEDQAIETHFGVGRTIRNTLRDLHAPLPEDLPSAPSIRKQLEDRRRARTKQLRSRKQQDDQNTLF